MKNFYFIAFILASILSFVSACVIGEGNPSPYVVLGGVSGLMSAVGLGAFIDSKGWGTCY